ncbi:MAG TPA: endopeptidase La [Candidatus Kapabacteria bacterium]|nr:endopeptidase La [Candidatus Kapabacteria bacterium]
MKRTNSRRAKEKLPTTNRLPVLPLRDVVIFPNMIFPVLVGRELSLRAAAEALSRDKYIFLVAQRNSSVDEPQAEDIYLTGTVAKIVQMLRLPNGLMKILVEGESQGFIDRVVETSGFMEADVTVPTVIVPGDKKMEALLRQASDLFQEYTQLHRGLPQEVMIAFDNIAEPVRKLYFIAANLISKVEAKQRILETREIREQYMELITILKNEIEVLKLEQEIDTKVQDTIQRSQRQFLIQEQIRALQTELEEEGEVSPELGKLLEAIREAKMPQEVEVRAYEELEKLRKTPMMSPEFAVNRNYLEWLTAVPWSRETEDNLDIHHVKQVLDEDHFGLERPKERILEHIAVLNLVKEMRGQILCLVGPPGVGKTSLGKSIARALGRKFVRVSLGGVRDEAEIRGHRRTYIGSMPGKILQSMKRAGVTNPVLLLDEIDKMSADFRGDPSSAMLEVLDPEQNSTFNDHYLEVDYDLSKVLFITTANVLFNIPLPLQDRMEIIELNGYLEYEKLEIAKRHIIPKQLKEHGLDRYRITFTDAAILKVIREYTAEAGVRNLEREIASLCRKVAKQLISSGVVTSSVREAPPVKARASGRGRRPGESVTLTPDLVEHYLKVPRYRNRVGEKEDLVGAATGLAWTSVGGDTLTVEVSIVPGTEKLTLTGQLGDVMKESVSAAITYIRANAERLGVSEDFSKGKEIHVHVPEGAIPKDGPSAGITMAVAVISAATGRPIRSDVAMTGEITLRGRILPIGGLTEKLIAARRVGIRTVIIPRDNVKDLADISDTVKQSLEIIPVATLIEAVPHIFRLHGVPANQIATHRARQSTQHPKTHGSA